jgi:hypothetical protein
MIKAIAFSQIKTMRLNLQKQSALKFLAELMTLA